MGGIGQMPCNFFFSVNTNLMGAEWASEWNSYCFCAIEWGEFRDITSNQGNYTSFPEGGYWCLIFMFKLLIGLRRGKMECELLR